MISIVRTKYRSIIKMSVLSDIKDKFCRCIDRILQGETTSVASRQVIILSILKVD